MNSSFLDRSMDSVNFTSNTFMEPQMKTTRKPVKMKENNHLERIFDQTTVNQHFSGSHRDMKMDFRPKSSYDMDNEVEQAHPVQQRRPVQQKTPTNQSGCQYCESYRKKNANYESMISGYEKKLSESMSKIKVMDSEKATNQTNAKGIRTEYDNISHKLKQKENECTQLEKKISSIQLERNEKEKSRVEQEIQKVNKKYYEMVQHYEKVISDLKKSQQPTQQNPMLTKLIPLLCKKLNKTEEQIKEKLINYPLPEKLNSEDLKNIIDLYK
jgi:chromosome segregation ATPase